MKMLSMLVEILSKFSTLTRTTWSITRSTLFSRMMVGTYKRLHGPTYVAFEILQFFNQLGVFHHISHYISPNIHLTTHSQLYFMASS